MKPSIALGDPGRLFWLLLRLGQPSWFKTLLDAGAKVNVQDVRGMTPLMLAVATDRQSPEVIAMLIAKGANRT